MTSLATAPAALTFAMPVYDQSEVQFGNAVASVLAQPGNFEFVVVDDSSEWTVDYAAIVGALHDPRIRYVRNDGEHGIGPAWNRCIAEARTAFVTIVHADDELKRNYASLMLGLAERYPAASMYFCGAEIIDDRGRRTFSLPDAVKSAILPRGQVFQLVGESGLVHLCIGDFIMCPTVMYRRADLRAPAFSTKFRQVVDLDLYLDALFNGRTIVGTREVAYRYRRHAASTTKKLTNEGGRFVEEIGLYLAAARRADERSLARAAFVARVMPLVRANLLLTLLVDVANRRFRPALRKLGYLCAWSEATLHDAQKRCL